MRRVSISNGGWRCDAAWVPSDSAFCFRLLGGHDSGQLAHVSVQIDRLGGGFRFRIKVRSERELGFRSCYDLTKGYVTAYTGWERKDVRTAFASAFVAGFFMTCTVSPTDNLRTRLMNQPTDKKIYDGFVDCAVKTVKEDGVLSLWRGLRRRRRCSC